MKVVLTQDVAKIGRRFEIVNVPDGYALNKLIPQKQALPATAINVKRVETMKKRHAEDAAGESKAVVDAIEKLKDKIVAVKVEANAEGKMFQALKVAVIIAAVAAETEVTLKPTWIDLPTPIKTTGEHTVFVSFGDTQGEFTINVIS